MKSLAILLLSCFSALAQSPLVTGSGIDWTKPPASGADYTSTLYVDLETDTNTSLGSAYVNGNVVSWWTNIAPWNPNVTLAVYSPTTTSAVWPKLNTAATTPTGKSSIDFAANNGSSGTAIPKITAAGSNQPNTVLQIVRYPSGLSSTSIDTWAGARSLERNYAAVGSDYFNFSGTSWNVGNGDNRFIPNNQWFLLTVVHNGANSYMRTNGVLIGTGDLGAAGFGSIQLGNDNTFVTPWKNQFAAIRIYQELMNTNNLHIAEQNLATRYLGSTLPSP